MEIVWKDIPGYEGFYKVSNTGLVKSLDRIVFRTQFGKRIGHILRGKVLKNSKTTLYPMVGLYKEIGNPKKMNVHVLVAISFIGEIPHKHQVNHIDGNKSNNNISNLEIITASQNCLHAFKIGLRKSNLGKTIKRKLSNDAVLFIRENPQITGVALAKKYNVTPKAISLIRTFKNKINNL